MDILSGPRLKKLSTRLREQYLSDRIKLIDAYGQGGYPYGGHRLNREEQLMRAKEMSVEDFEALITNLNNKYRGQPNAYDLVNKDIAQYFNKMIGLMLGYGEEMPSA